MEVTKESRLTFATFERWKNIGGCEIMLLFAKFNYSIHQVSCLPMAEFRRVLKKKKKVHIVSAKGISIICVKA